MYDFHKSRKENNENEFKHQFFQKNQKELMSLIKRKINEQSNSSNSGLQLMKRMNPQMQAYIEHSLDIENSEKIRMLESKQRSMEQTLSLIISQNTKLMEENKILLQEIFKAKLPNFHNFRERNERKIEQLLMFMVSIFNPSYIKTVENKGFSINPNNNFTLVDKNYYDESTKLIRNLLKKIQDRSNEEKEGNIKSLFDENLNQNRMLEIELKKSLGGSSQNDKEDDQNSIFPNYLDTPIKKTKLEKENSLELFRRNSRDNASQNYLIESPFRDRDEKESVDQSCWEPNYNHREFNFNLDNVSDTDIGVNLFDSIKSEAQKYI